MLIINNYLIVALVGIYKRLKKSLKMEAISKQLYLTFRIAAVIGRTEYQSQDSRVKHYTWTRYEHEAVTS